MALLWLAVLVMSVCLLCSEKDPDSPIKNLRMEPGSRRLTWDLSGNVSEIKCFINSKYITKAIDSRYCQFYVLPLCEVKNFTISVKQDPPFSTGLQYVPRGAEGKPAAAARGLDCWVHDVDFLTCSWEVGRAAPGDVQYRLYWRDLKAYREQECPRYEANNRGVHVRCRFDDVSRLQRHIQFWVNGTSRRSGIPCSDLCVELPEIERLSPPHITATCNKSYSMMEWKVLSHFNHRFLYELQIQKGTDPASTEKLYENHFVIYNPGNYVAKLKVQGFFRKDWSEWSAPQLFVCDPKDEHRRDWLVSVLVLLGTLLVLGLVALLCRRYSVLQKLFPPIPHMKDPITDNLQSPKLVGPGTCWGGGVREEEATAPPAEEREAGPVLVGGRMVGGWGRLPGDSHTRSWTKSQTRTARTSQAPVAVMGGRGRVCSPA
uniref:Interleukin-3 receptor subunit alpha n=1 Tax=Canis lupus familiaris TaxID=9615 RepID=A0A8I3PHK9_CANLF